MSQSRLPSDTQAPRWAVLLVGDDPFADPLAGALRTRGIEAACARTAAGVHAVVGEAPDLLVLLGSSRDRAENADALGGDGESAALPLVVLADSALAQPSRAFTQGVVGRVQQGLGPEEAALEVERILRELPTRPGTSRGAVDEASLDALVDVLARELRSGVLSIRGERDARLMLRSGQPVGETLEQFVERARPIVTHSDAARYDFWEQPGGRLASAGSAPGAPAASVEQLAARRVLVVHSDSAVAAAWVAALTTAGATAMALTHKSRINPVRSFDPEVVLVTPSAMGDPDDRLLSIVQRDERLRWGAMLVAPVEALEGAADAERHLPALAREVEELCRPQRELDERAATGEAFETRLEAVGPAHLLRVVLARCGRARIDVEHPHAALAVSVSDGRLVSARGLRRDRGTEMLHGAHALNLLLSLRTGRARIRPGVGREKAEQPLDVDLDEFRHGRPSPLPSLAPPPLVSKIPPAPRVPVEASRNPLRTTMTLPSPAEARSLTVALGLVALGVLLAGIAVLLAL